jgi:hypothetical protein
MERTACKCEGSNKNRNIHSVKKNGHAFTDIYQEKEGIALCMSFYSSTSIVHHVDISFKVINAEAGQLIMSMRDFVSAASTQMANEREVSLQNDMIRRRTTKKRIRQVSDCNSDKSI